MAENEKRRLSQLEEQLSNTLRAVDKLHADVEAFKDYAIENNKVVNSMLKKMDERHEEILKIEKRLEENDKKWNASERKWGVNEKKWEANERKWEASERKWEANEKKWETSERKWEANERKWEKNQAHIDALIQEVIRLRKEK